MAALLAKFRIDFSDVIVIPDVTKRATDDTRQEHRQILDSLPEGRFSKFFFMYILQRRCINFFSIASRFF